MDMEKNGKWRQPGQFWWLLPLFLYLAVNAVLILNHESWRDEAQAWQIARQSGLKELFEQLKYEGHPCLWYLVLMPFAKLGYPFSGLGFLSLFFMAAAVWLLLAKSPFSPPVKLLSVFGSAFVYFYPVIARSYCLIPPLLAFLALLYPVRREKPVRYGAMLGLLTQTHVLAAALSFSLSAAWLLETVFEWRTARQNEMGKQGAAVWGGLGISLLSGLFLVWELAGSIGNNASVHVRVSSSLGANLRQMGEAVWKAMQEFLGMKFDGTGAMVLMVLAAIGLAVLLFYAPRETVTLAAAYFIQILIFAYVYPAGIQSSLILVHESIFLLWIILQKDGGRKFQRIGVQAGLAALLFVSLWNRAPDIYKDLELPYSSSKGMAACVRQNVPEEAPLIATGDLSAVGLSAYLPEREIWNPAEERTVEFSVWDERREKTISYEELVDRVMDRYPQAEGMYLICGEKSQVPDWPEHTGEMEEICRLDFCIADEGAVLYYAEFPDGEK